MLLLDLSLVHDERFHVVHAETFSDSCLVRHWDVVQLLLLSLNDWTLWLTAGTSTLSMLLVVVWWGWCGWRRYMTESSYKRDILNFWSIPTKSLPGSARVSWFWRPISTDEFCSKYEHDLWCWSSSCERARSGFVWLLIKPPRRTNAFVLWFWIANPFQSFILLQDHN